MDMYKGSRKFNREQLVFVVEAAFAAALDRIDSGLPSSGVKAEDRVTAMHCLKPEDLSSWDMAVLSTSGMTVAILCAQLTGDGLGIGDAIDTKTKEGSLLTVAEKFVEEAVKGKWPKKGKNHPDCRKLAEAWVDKIFFDKKKPAGDFIKL